MNIVHYKKPNLLCNGIEIRKNKIDVPKNMLKAGASDPPETIAQINDSSKEYNTSGKKGDKVQYGTQEE